MSGSILSDDAFVDDDVDETSRESFMACLLRFRFQDHAFLGLWRALKEVGWTHDSATRTYRSPAGRIFDGAWPVVKYLDYHSIAEVRSTLESPTDRGGDNDEDDGETNGKDRLPSRKSSKMVWTDEEQDLAWTLRKQAVLELWKRAEKKTRSTPAHDNDDGDHANDSDAESHVASSDDDRRRTTRRSPRLSLGSHDASISADRAVPRSTTSSSVPIQSETVTEKGTSLYLAKKSRRVRFKKSRSTDAEAGTASMAKLVAPTLDVCQRRLREASKCRRDAGAVDSFRIRFEDWRWLLSTNHSLLFYGAGSKRDLLNSFADQELSKEGYVLVLDGCDKDITIEGILDVITNMFLGDSKRDRLLSRSRAPHMDGIEGVTAAGTYSPWKAEPVVERAIQIGRALADTCGEALAPLFLVVHTLEGLGNRVAQEALSNLLVNSVVANGAAAVRLAASVDHVDAPLLWTTATKANFSFLYEQVHTHQPYAEELCMLPAKKKKAVSASARTKAVKTATPRNDIASTEFLKLLAPRIVEVVQILARLQLDAVANHCKGDVAGMVEEKEKRSSKRSTEELEPTRIPFRTLARECTRACAINKESQLKTYLAEVHDHGLVNYDEDLVCIPHGPETLKELLTVSHRPKG